MVRKVVKTDALEVDDQTYPVTYFELRTQRGLRRYSAEILLGPDDRIILDDDSMTEPRGQDGAARAGDALQPDAGGQGHGGLRHPPRRTQQRRLTHLAAAAPTGYFRGSTASFSCFAILALTTVFAGILIASPVAGLRPMRALRF